MNDDQKFPFDRLAYRNEALFFFRVQGIVDSQREWISERGSSFLKGYAVFLGVACGFVLVPLKPQAHVARSIYHRRLGPQWISTPPGLQKPRVYKGLQKFDHLDDKNPQNLTT